jgi:hypothetical protein
MRPPLSFHDASVTVASTELHPAWARRSDPKLYILIVYGALRRCLPAARPGDRPTRPDRRGRLGSLADCRVIPGAALLEERLARPSWHVAVAVASLAVACAGAAVIS